MPESILPPELSKISEEITSLEDEPYGSAMQGKFTVSALNQLVDALNRVLPLFDTPAYATFTEVPDPLPAEFARLLTMVLTAASDSGLLPSTDLASIKSDRDLTMLAGKIRSLEGNRDFKEFLQAEAPPPEAMPKVAGEESMPPDAEMEEMDMEALMASRV